LVFYPLYLAYKTSPALRDIIFFFRCVVVRQARVGYKTSDLNDAELPYSLSPNARSNTCEQDSFRLIGRRELHFYGT